VSWPMTMIMSFEFLTGLTDIYIAGKVGKETQAAYGFIIQFYFVFVIIANALTAGSVSVISQLFTSENKKDLGDAVYSTLLVALTAGVPLSLAGILLTPSIIGMINIPAELKPRAIIMGRIYAAGLLFHYLLISSNGILRACKRIKKSLMTMALVCFLNITLNLFLVFHTPLGYRGIATATATSVFLGSLLNVCRVKVLMGTVKRYSLAIVKRILSIGWPMGLTQTLWQFHSMVIYLILSALPSHNVEILAALSAGLRIESAIFLPAFAFNMANAVVVGNLLGEKRKDDAFRGGLITGLMGVPIVIVLTLIVILNARWIAASLSSNQIVVAECVRYLYVNMLSEPFMAWGIILGGGLIGAGDTRGVMVMMAISVWLVRIPLAYTCVAVMGLGALSVWWSMNLSQLVMALLMTRRYLRRQWLEQRLL